MSSHIEHTDTIDEQKLNSGLDRTTVVERQFLGIWQGLVNFGLALISILVIYWTIFATADVVIKRSLYLMITLALCAVVYPFNKKSSRFHVSLIDGLIDAGVGHGREVDPGNVHNAAVCGLETAIVRHG